MDQSVNVYQIKRMTSMNRVKLKPFYFLHRIEKKGILGILTPTLLPFNFN